MDELLKTEHSISYSRTTKFGYNWLLFLCVSSCVRVCVCVLLWVSALHDKLEYTLAFVPLLII